MRTFNCWGFTYL